MSGAQPLVLRFAADLEPAKRGLTELASNAYQKFSTVNEAAELAARGLELVAQKSTVAGQALGAMSREARAAASAFVGSNENLRARAGEKDRPKAFSRASHAPPFRKPCATM